MHQKHPTPSFFRFEMWHTHTNVCRSPNEPTKNTHSSPRIGVYVSLESFLFVFFPNFVGCFPHQFHQVFLICFSPPVRWGLLDFMSVSSPLLPPRAAPVPGFNHDLVCSVWRVGPQLRAREFSVACRTSTASSWVQCGVSDPNRELVSSVWRAGPQPGARELSVACRTSTAIPRVQCGVPDTNRDPASSVWRVGPQVLCQKTCQKEWQKICQKECQKICQKKCQKECQKICQKECQKICQKEC